MANLATSQHVTVRPAPRRRPRRRAVHERQMYRGALTVTSPTTARLRLVDGVWTRRTDAAGSPLTDAYDATGRGSVYARQCLVIAPVDLNLEGLASVAVLAVNGDEAELRIRGGEIESGDVVIMPGEAGARR